MKKIIIPALAVLSVAACSTPKTILKNPQTGQVATCGGSATGSLVGGVIGYHIQKSNDSQCAQDYMENGFTVVRTTEKTVVKQEVAEKPKATSNINKTN